MLIFSILLLLSSRRFIKNILPILSVYLESNYLRGLNYGSEVVTVTGGITKELKSLQWTHFFTLYEYIGTYISIILTIKLQFLDNRWIQIVQICM